MGNFSRGYAGIRAGMSAMLAAFALAFLALTSSVTPANATCSVSAQRIETTSSTSIYPFEGGPPSKTVQFTAFYTYSSNTSTPGGRCTDPSIVITPTLTPSDGGFSAANCSFTLDVINASDVTNGAASGSCSLTWTAPTGAGLPAAAYTVGAAVLPPVSNPWRIPSADTDNLHLSLTRAPAAPSFTAVKSSVDASYSAVGDVLDYSILVTNTGNVTLTGVTISDAFSTDDSCTAVSIAPRGNKTCRASHTVTQADLDAGSVSNTASTATDPPAPYTTLFRSTRAPAAPSFTAVKSSVDASYSAVGDVLDYSILVTNTGNVTLTGVTISDALTTDESCPAGNIAPDSSRASSTKHTDTQVDTGAGSDTNTDYAHT